MNAKINELVAQGADMNQAVVSQLNAEKELTKQLNQQVSAQKQEIDRLIVVEKEKQITKLQTGQTDLEHEMRKQSESEKISITETYERTIAELKQQCEDQRKDMKRLESGALAREARTIASMIELYCRAHHGTKSGLCPECEELNAYARKRLSCCPFGQDKPVCAKCKVHCYKPAMREKIGAVMRFAGPRIVFVHPLLSLEHLWKSLTVMPPEKPRAKPHTQTIKAMPEAAPKEQKKN